MKRYLKPYCKDPVVQHGQTKSGNPTLRWACFNRNTGMCVTAGPWIVEQRGVLADLHREIGMMVSERKAAGVEP